MTINVNRMIAILGIVLFIFLFVTNQHYTQWTNDVRLGVVICVVVIYYMPQFLNYIKNDFRNVQKDMETHK